MTDLEGNDRAKCPIMPSNLRVSDEKRREWIAMSLWDTVDCFMLERVELMETMFRLNVMWKCAYLYQCVGNFGY